jgi:cell division protease FtsH
VFQEVSTGGHNDLQHATDVARAMVAEYGMSDAVGPVAVRTRARTVFLPVPGMDAPEPIAQETAREIDLEVKRLMSEAHEQALQILGEHRLTLDAVVRLLLEHEVVEGEEVRRLLAAEAVPALRIASG